MENKNIATLETEIYKRDAIAINRLGMYRKLQEMYGTDTAEEYLRQLEEHEIYRNDETGILGKSYCASVTLYPFLFHGNTCIGGTSEAPKNLASFNGAFINLVFALASQFCGAISTPEWLSYMDYFIRREYGDDYYLHADNVVDLSTRHRTIDKVITDGFEQVVYSINQPAAARGNQSCFWNIAYFDHPYFDGMFENFVFPDGTPMKWESVNWLQKRFMKWFNQERRRKLLTFPVETVNLLDDGTDFVDQEWANFTAEMWAEGHSFFVYRSDSVDSLASCCFAPDTRVLAKSSKGVFLTSIEELHNMKYTGNKPNFCVFHNGSWKSANTIALPKRQMYRIRTTNKKEVVATDNHLFPTLRGDVRADELTEDDYILFNTMVLDAIPERNDNLTYAQGFLIGMYLGDGSMDTNGPCQSTTNFSLNAEKYEQCIKLMNEALEDIGIVQEFSLGKIYNHVYPVRLYGDALKNFILKYVSGRYASEKRLNTEALMQSREFRRGILDGLYATDGGNNNRIYTTSESLLHDMECLCTSLGLNTVIDISDRTDEPVIIRGAEWKRNYPLYCLRWYGECNKRSMGNIYVVRNNGMYFRVNMVEKLNDTSYETVYCFEVKDQREPYFTLPNGMITHNCRLRNELQDNTFSYTLGAGGVSTGSKCVMTINVNRLVQNAIWDDPMNDIREAMSVMVDKVHKYLLAFNAILKDRQAAGLLPVYDARFVKLEKQYLTVGINGFIEGAESLGIEPEADNPEYVKYAEAVLQPIYAANRRDRSEDIMWNCEMIPAESLGVKNATWDRAEKLFVPRDCYNSYFFRVEDPKVNVLDKLKLHGREFTRYLDGGSACHINLDEHLTKEQYALLLRAAIRTGCNYLTFNVPNTLCRSCGYISKRRLDKCPKCGSDDLDYATRVIGYLKLISRFAEARQEEAGRRHYSKGLEDDHESSD